MKGLFAYVPSEEMGRRVKAEVMKRKCGKGVAMCSIVRYLNFTLSISDDFWMTQVRLRYGLVSFIEAMVHNLLQVSLSSFPTFSLCDILILRELSMC